MSKYTKNPPVAVDFRIVSSTTPDGRETFLLARPNISREGAIEAITAVRTETGRCIALASASIPLSANDESVAIPIAILENARLHVYFNASAGHQTTDAIASLHMADGRVYEVESNHGQGLPPGVLRARRRFF